MDDLTDLLTPQQYDAAVRHAGLSLAAAARTLGIGHERVRQLRQRVAHLLHYANDPPRNAPLSDAQINPRLSMRSDISAPTRAWVEQRRSASFAGAARANGLLLGEAHRQEQLARKKGALLY